MTRLPWVPPPPTSMVLPHPCRSPPHALPGTWALLTQTLVAGRVIVAMAHGMVRLPTWTGLWGGCPCRTVRTKAHLAAAGMSTLAAVAAPVMGTVELTPKATLLGTPLILNAAAVAIVADGRPATLPWPPALHERG